LFVGGIRTPSSKTPFPLAQPEKEVLLFFIVKECLTLLKYESEVRHSLPRTSYRLRRVIRRGMGFF
jgi:hypothetical protein